MLDTETAGRLATDAPAATTELTNTKSVPEPDAIFKRLPVTLTLTPAQQECARIITAGRQRGKHLADPTATIGTAELDFEATYFGTLAELAVYHWLEEQGRRPVYTLLDRKAVTKADFTLNSLRYEVKCAPPGKPYLAINQAQHHDPRRACDYYVCALYDSPDALRVCPLLPHADISQWQPMTNGHAPYFSRHRSELLSPTPTVAAGKPEDTRAFFAALMQAYDDPALRIEIRPAFPAWQQANLYPQGDAPGNWQFLTPYGKREWFPLSDAGIRLAADHALELAGRYETYYGVLPRTGRAGKAADVPAAACLWCDIDGGFEGVEGAQTLLDAAVQSARLPAPHFSVCSGGGLHVYWRLSAPVLLADEASCRRFKQILQRLCRVIGGASPAAHADSSRADVASILRVPGSFNRKREQEPRPVRLLPVAPAEARSLAWWGANLPALPAPPTTKYPPPDPAKLGSQDGLIRWAKRPYPEGKRHKDLAGAAAWLVRDVGLTKPLAKELLLLKAQASAGTRLIKPEEVEAMIEWV